jgi:hypothetical protein
MNLKSDELLLLLNTGNKFNHELLLNMAVELTDIYIYIYGRTGRQVHIQHLTSNVMP